MCGEFYLSMIIKNFIDTFKDTPIFRFSRFTDRDIL